MPRNLDLMIYPTEVFDIAAGKKTAKITGLIPLDAINVSESRVLGVVRITETNRDATDHDFARCTEGRRFP